MQESNANIAAPRIHSSFHVLQFQPSIRRHESMYSDSVPAIHFGKSVEFAKKLSPESRLPRFSNWKVSG